jgi:hypothetical protein
LDEKTGESNADSSRASRATDLTARGTCAIGCGMNAISEKTELSELSNQPYPFSVCVTDAKKIALTMKRIMDAVPDDKASSVRDDCFIRS